MPPPDCATSTRTRRSAGRATDVLRTLATSFALAEFPVFYDTSWERRLSVFTLDNGDGWTLPDRQADGSPT